MYNICNKYILLQCLLYEIWPVFQILLGGTILSNSTTVLNSAFLKRLSKNSRFRCRGQISEIVLVPTIYPPAMHVPGSYYTHDTPIIARRALRRNASWIDS